MVNLDARIRAIFPGIKPDQYVLQDDGDGPYIAKWLSDQPQPSAAQLLAANVASIEAVRTIGVIERENPITHRALRELILTIGEAFPAGKNTVFYQRVLATEQLIAAERAKL